MRKLALTAACALAQYATVAGAVEIDVTTMEFYPPGSTAPAHVNDTVEGSIDFDTGTGAINSGTTPFFGADWNADVAETWNTAGSFNFSGTGYSYDFVLGANQYAAGLLFDWSVNQDIPVLAAFDCSTGTSCTPIDTDADGIPGTAMATSPFPGQTPAFSGVLVDDGGNGGGTPPPAVPVPAAVWLFGSGLLGLLGVARKKR